MELAELESLEDDADRPEPDLELELLDDLE